MLSAGRLGVCGRARFRSFNPMFPGTQVSSLISGIDVPEPGVRLQSMIRRE
jgi:hypothetical protein